MWKYVVAYFLLKSVPCPEVLDEFGRKPEISTDLRGRLPCFVTDTLQKEKYFDTRKEATAFIERGKKLGDLGNFKLDSIPLAQYNCQHLSIMVTAMGCPDGVKCNSATCMTCGKVTAHY